MGNIYKVWKSIHHQLIVRRGDVSEEGLEEEMYQRRGWRRRCIRGGGGGGGGGDVSDTWIDFEVFIK